LPTAWLSAIGVQLVLGICRLTLGPAGRGRLRADVPQKLAQPAGGEFWQGRGSKSHPLPSRTLGSGLGDLYGIRRSLLEAYYRQALALSEPLRMRPLGAHYRAGLAKLYERTGNRLQAWEQFDTAVAMYRGMAMRFLLDKVEAEMKQIHS
jgi:hypothetical protein